jgi:hypothetical protein
MEVRAMNDALTELEAAAHGIVQPPPARNQYAFVSIAHELAASLTKGAEDNLHEATALLDSVKILVEEIKKHVKEHADMLDDAHARTVAYGESVLAAHKEFINGGKHENPTP